MSVVGADEKLSAGCGVLACTLLDRRTSVPFSDALITCAVSGSRILQANADMHGEFRAEFPEGAYDLVISARGELSLSLRGIGVLGGHVQHLTRALLPGDAVDSTPASAIGGYLVDRLGHPVTDAAITLSRVGGNRYTTQSDRVGAYIMHGVEPGEYDMVIRNTKRTLYSDHVVVPEEKSFLRRDVRIIAV